MSVGNLVPWGWMMVATMVVKMAVSLVYDWVGMKVVN
jgi:hypothetical protein